jgi:hypothetical protein
MTRPAAHATAAIAAAFLAAIVATAAQAQQAPLFAAEDLQAVGWRGFLDWRFLLEAVGALVLATALGALIAFHPMTPRTVDTLAEAELPKVYILYALIGAMVGVTVLEYGLVVGFVVFGLGGLMRFRTDMDSTRDTGRLIVVTLIGLICGLNLPHFAVLSALFAFGLIYVFDAQPICRMVVKALPENAVPRAAEAYRTALANAHCRVLSEKKGFAKRRVEFVFRMPREATRESLHAELARIVPAEIRGELDWEVE